MFKTNLTCVITRNLNKEEKEYYTIDIEELGYRGFLSKTEIKLFELLVQSGGIKIIEE